MAFEKGRSGNPSGRPRSARLPGPDQLRADLLRDEVPAILAALVTQARGGDAQAARLILDRCLPALRPQDPPAPLPPGVDLSDLAGAPAAVLEALSAGTIGTDQAGALAGVLAALVKVRESVELEKRIEALELKR